MTMYSFRFIASVTVAAALVTSRHVQAQASTMTPPPAVGADGKPVVRSLGHPSADTAAVLVSMLATENRDEIAAGRLAQQRAARPDVRAYAQRMMTEHAAELDSLKANAESGGWVVKDSMGRTPGAAKSADSAGVSEMSTPSLGISMREASIHGASATAMATLQKSNGAAFDKAYIDWQVKGHEALLKAITAQTTGNERLQKQLTAAQKSSEIHLDEARKIQKLMLPAGAEQ